MRPDKMAGSLNMEPNERQENYLPIAAQSKRRFIVMRCVFVRYERHFQELKTVGTIPPAHS